MPQNHVLNGVWLRCMTAVSRVSQEAQHAAAKTGPRMVWLSEAAQAVIARQPRGGSAFVFPSPRDPSKPLSRTLRLWCRARREAGIEDVRLHDLRHTVASQAVAQGVPLPTVARMLGHAQPTMTLRYAHVGDHEVEAAAERVGAIIVNAMAIFGRRRKHEAASGYNDRQEGRFHALVPSTRAGGMYADNVSSVSNNLSGTPITVSDNPSSNPR